jgi:hypothetical protein
LPQGTPSGTCRGRVGPRAGHRIPTGLRARAARTRPLQLPIPRARSRTIRTGVCSSVCRPWTGSPDEREPTALLAVVALELRDGDPLRCLIAHPASHLHHQRAAI